MLLYGDNQWYSLSPVSGFNVMLYLKKEFKHYLKPILCIKYTLHKRHFVCSQDIKSLSNSFRRKMPSCEQNGAEQNIHSFSINSRWCSSKQFISLFLNCKVNCFISCTCSPLFCKHILYIFFFCFCFTFYTSGPSKDE